MIKRYVQNQAGYSLLLTIFAMVFITILAVSILSVTMMTTEVTVSERANQSSYYIAEAGLVEKRAELNTLAANAYTQVRSEYEALSADKKKTFNFEQTFYQRVKKRVEDNLVLSKTTNYEAQSTGTPVSAAEVKLVSASPLTYEITSTGTVPASGSKPAQTKELSQRVTVQMSVDQTKENVTIPGTKPVKYRACFAIHAKGNFNHNGGNLKGPIYVEGNTNLSGGGSSISGNLYSKGNVSLTGGGSYIIGNVFTEGQVQITPNIGAYINGTITQRTALKQYQNDCVAKVPQLPDVTTAFPATNVTTLPNQNIGTQYNRHDVIKDGNLNINSWLIPEVNYTLTLDRDVYFKSINIASDYRLRIDLKGANRKIYVDHLNFVQGSIEFINPGKLEIIVQDKFTLTGGSKFNANNSRDQLTLRYAGSDPLVFAGGTAINGSLHVKNAPLTLDGGNNLAGDLYQYGSATITIKGGASASDKLIVSPNGNLVLSEGGSARGNIVVKDFSISGGGTTTPPTKDYGEWELPGSGTSDQVLEIIRFGADGSFLQSDPLVEE